MAGDSDKAPATFGGPGWRVRSADHAADVDAGKLWSRCGVTNEWGRLHAILLSWPSERFSAPTAPDESLMLSWPDQTELQRQCEATVAFFESQGVTVHLHRPTTPPPVNYLFMRDLVFMCADGAVLARPASPVRAPEARWAQCALADAGVPILSSISGDGTFEGADALWIGTDTVLVGMGTRTNKSGVEQLRSVLASRGVTVKTVNLPPGVQHLLGVFVLLDHDLAMVQTRFMTPEIESVLQHHGIQVIAFTPDQESVDRRGLNGVVLGPREVVIPSGCPGIEKCLLEAGVQVHSVGVDAYIQAAGALGCMTAILGRD